MLVSAEFTEAVRSDLPALVARLPSRPLWQSMVIDLVVVDVVAVVRAVALAVPG